MKYVPLIVAVPWSFFRTGRKYRGPPQVYDATGRTAEGRLYEEQLLAGAKEINDKILQEREEWYRQYESCNRYRSGRVKSDEDTSNRLQRH